MASQAVVHTCVPLSAYVSIRQHTSYLLLCDGVAASCAYVCPPVSIRQHTLSHTHTPSRWSKVFVAGGALSVCVCVVCVCVCCVYLEGGAKSLWQWNRSQTQHAQHPQRGPPQLPAAVAPSPSPTATVTAPVIQPIDTY